jgi:NADPH:quinone reductase-like Zn-dependent oxidoreductase
VSEQQLPRLDVLGFGGGVSELFLQLAKSEGHNAYFCSGSPERRDALEKQGIVGIDQKAFNRFASREDVSAFRKHVAQLTASGGAHIVCDMLRGPVFEAGLAVAAREGVNISAGWQLSQVVTYNSTVQSVKQVTIDHTHYETIPECAVATQLYGKVFTPTVHKEIYAFEDLPRAFEEMHQNTQTGIPIIRVAQDMPDAVKGLTP